MLLFDTPHGKETWMKLWLPMLLSAALLAVGGAAAFAVPSLAGPTGLVMLPTADIAPTTDWQIGIGHRSFKVAQMYGAEDIDVSIWALSALKGVAGDAELWIAFQRATNGEDANVWEYGAKYLIRQNLLPRGTLLGGTKVAVGASLGRWSDAVGFGGASMYDETITATDVKTLRAYMVATKQFAPTYTGEWPWGEAPGTRIVGSAGVMYLRVDPDIGGGDSLLRPFLGVQCYGRRNLELLAEYRFKDSNLEDDSLFSVAIRKPWGTSTNLEIGLTNASPIGLATGDQSMYVRLTYTWPTAGYQ
jgi:hypothetical protein